MKEIIKRSLALSLALMMSISIVGCNENENNTTKTEEEILTDNELEEEIDRAIDTIR